MEEEYELSDSEDDYSKEDKLILEDSRRSMKRKEISSDEEVFGFDQSDSESNFEERSKEEEEDGIDMGSDIEEEEKLPDERAWGRRKRSFYNTDFVDQDYDGTYVGEEAEIAELEEREARSIQKRLTQQLDEADFSIAEAGDLGEAAEATEKQETIHSDFTKLTKRQKLDLLKKESPEFFVLVQDFKDKMMEAQKLYSVICYFKKCVQKPLLELQFIQTNLSLILNYCTNISCYLLLKAKRVSVKNHPIMKSLFRYRQLLEHMEEANKKIEPELKNILDMMEAKKEIQIENLVAKRKRLKLVAKHKRQREKKMLKKRKRENEGESVAKEIEYKGANLAKDTEKRAITYEMAKNKGLIPKRSKEQRNPRVKHRRKYEKAKIRRRGQVRTPRAEIPVYGGEQTGIKIGLVKGIKFK